MYIRMDLKENIQKIIRTQENIQNTFHASHADMQPCLERVLRHVLRAGLLYNNMHNFRKIKKPQRKRTVSKPSADNFRRVVFCMCT